MTILLHLPTPVGGTCAASVDIVTLCYVIGYSAYSEEGQNLSNPSVNSKKLSLLIADTVPTLADNTTLNLLTVNRDLK